WMTAIALWVASLPGAVGRVAAFGTWPLLLGTAGLLLVCLLRSPLRWSGGLLIVAAVMSVARTPLPDVLVAASGDAVAVRTANGRLAIVKAGNDAFVAREWLAADGDARSPTDKALADGFSCDDAGCVARLADGTLISFAHTPEAIAEDCGVAALGVTRRELPPGCAAQGVERKLW